MKNKKLFNIFMNKTEILFWKDKYNQEEDLYSKNDESELHEKFKKNQFVTKKDLVRIVKWKFQGRLIGRQKRILNLLADTEDSYIQEVSGLALKSDKDELKLKLLSSIKGVGNALSSVILTFNDPKNYGILDIHVWRALFGKEPTDVFSNHKHAIKFFNKLREITLKTGLSARDVEKAYFKKDLDSSKTN